VRDVPETAIRRLKSPFTPSKRAEHPFRQVFHQPVGDKWRARFAPGDAFAYVAMSRARALADMRRRASATTPGGQEVWPDNHSDSRPT
jgi:hypothetical protein